MKKVKTKTKADGPRILFFDIESIGVNALKSDLGLVCCFGFKWQGDKAQCLTLSKKDLANFSDRALLRQASEIMAQADLLVTHFGSVFDRRFFQGRLLINGLPPIPKTPMRDTVFMARSIANFSSNRLKHLAKILGLKNQKLENGWPEAWFAVMKGDMKALMGMAEYCKGDVLALEELYDRLKPFDGNHPNLFMNKTKCGLCGGEVQFRGRALANNKTYRRYQCKKCAKWGRETVVLKETS